MASPQDDGELDIHVLSKEQRLDLVRLYFEYVHDKFHSIFHRPSVMIEIEEDRFPEVLLAGIAALAAR